MSALQGGDPLDLLHHVGELKLRDPVVLTAQEVQVLVDEIRRLRMRVANLEASSRLTRSQRVIRGTE